MTTLRLQSFRFVVVGLASNAVLYLFYILLTSAGFYPPAAVSIVFAIGALQTFLFNRQWTFSGGGDRSKHLARYLTAYVGAYMLNMLTLYIFVDQMDFPHRWVQAVAVVVIGALLFVGQRYWVFSSGRQKLSEMQ